MKKQFRELAKKETELARKEAQKEVELARKEAEQAAELARKETEQAVEKARADVEKAKADQEVKICRNDLITIISARFPNLTEFAQQQVEQFDKPEVFDLLIQRIVVAPDANTARFILNPRAEAHE
jgi:hypothetical protein